MKKLEPKNKHFSNYSLLITHYSRQRRGGFSFMEMLVTVSLLGIIMVGFSRLFTAALIGEKKAKNLEEVKQSGNYVLTIMSDMIRNAREVLPSSCTGTLSDSITILNQDGGITTFSCLQQDDPDPDKISSGSATTVDLMTNSKINVANCNIFTCQATTDKPSVVKIDFTLSVGASTDVKEYVSQNFRTTVSLRSY